MQELSFDGICYAAVCSAGENTEDSRAATSQRRKRKFLSPKLASFAQNP